MKSCQVRGKEQGRKEKGGSSDRQQTQRRMLCTLSRFNFSCSLDNQAPHGHPAATAVPKGLRHVVDETHHITADTGNFIMSAWVS